MTDQFAEVREFGIFRDGHIMTEVNFVGQFAGFLNGENEFHTKIFQILESCLGEVCVLADVRNGTSYSTSR